MLDDQSNVQLILLIGNYMNGTGIKGGAFGFRVSSINKVGKVYISHVRRADMKYTAQLVDTKSVNNTTLLHFLERTVAKHFPEMEEFLEDLAAPAEAHRGVSHGRDTVFVELNAITCVGSQLAGSS